MISGCIKSLVSEKVHWWTFHSQSFGVFTKSNIEMCVYAEISIQQCKSRCPRVFQSRHISSKGERRLSRIVHHKRTATMFQITSSYKTWEENNVSKQAVLRNFLRMSKLHSHPSRVLVLTACNRQQSFKWGREHRNWTTKKWNKGGCFNKSHFPVHHVDSHFGYANFLRRL